MAKMYFLTDVLGEVSALDTSELMISAIDADIAMPSGGRDINNSRDDRRSLRRPS